MAAVAWRAVYASAAAGAIGPSLDGGAVGNQTDVWPNAIRIGRYSVAAGKAVAVELLAFSFARPQRSVAAVAGASVSTGEAKVRIGGTVRLEMRVQGAVMPVGGGWEDAPQFWQSANALPPSMGNGISVGAGTVVDLVVTPAAATATMWRGSIWGLEGGVPVLLETNLVSYAVTADQVLLAYTPAATFTLLGFRLEGQQIGPVGGTARLALDGTTVADLGRQAFEESAAQAMDFKSGAFGAGAVFLPLWGVKLYPGESFEGSCNPWEPDGAEWQVALFGNDSDLAALGTYPAVGDVDAGVVYGPTANLTGTLVQPAAADVRAGTGFGAAGTEFTGSLVVGGGGAAGAFIPRRGR